MWLQMPDDPLTELFNYLFHYSGGSKELKAVPQKVLKRLEKCSKIDPKQGSLPPSARAAHYWNRYIPPGKCHYRSANALQLWLYVYKILYMLWYIGKLMKWFGNKICKSWLHTVYDMWVHMTREIGQDYSETLQFLCIMYNLTIITRLYILI